MTLIEYVHRQRLLDRRVLRFIAIGLLVSLIDLAVTYSAITISGTRTLSVSLGYCAGLLASYCLHGRVTFSVVLRPRAQFPRFLVLVALNYLLTLGVVWITSGCLEYSTMTGKLISLPLVAGSSFLAFRYWVYSAEVLDHKA